jgi:crotonobetainyl-CoA:carnitine CoA-transferase CaiB-like acyl-CoA transferase
VLGRSDLSSHPNFVSNAGRVSRRDALTEVLAAETARWPRDELLTALEAKGIPAGPINTVAEVFTDPQVQHRGMRVELPAPEAAGGAIPGVRTPIIMDEEPALAGRPAPALGAHTTEVLADPAWGGAGAAGGEGPDMAALLTSRS